MTTQTTIQIEKRRMGMAHRLAAELAQRDVDPNLMRTAAAFLKAYPMADAHDWLLRQARLGNLFSSSDQTGRYRHELMAACKRLRPQPADGQEWAFVLAWAARLFMYYQSDLRQARRISDVSRLELPEPPPVYEPPPPEKKAIPPKNDEPVSEKAEDIFAQLQKRWASQGGDADE